LPPVAAEVDEFVVPRWRSPPVGTKAGKSKRGEHEHLTQCMGTMKRPGRRRRDAEADESVSPRWRSPPVAAETDECCTASRSDDLCYNDEYEHLQSREMNTFSPQRINTDTYIIAVYKRCKPKFL
jgi:hypothetical protein